MDLKKPEKCSAWRCTNNVWTWTDKEKEANVYLCSNGKAHFYKWANNGFTPQALTKILSKPLHPKLEAQKDENGRLPLSPKMQAVFNILKIRMGSSWWDWEGMLRINSHYIGENQGTFKTRVNMIADRGWLERDTQKHEKTKRNRRYFKLPEEFVTFLCSGCEQWVKGTDDYLCEKCREGH